METEYLNESGVFMSHTLEVLSLPAKPFEQETEAPQDSASHADLFPVDFQPELLSLANMLNALAKCGSSRVIAILSVEPEIRSSQICFDLARILAASSSRPACLMQAGLEQKDQPHSGVEHPLLVAPNLWGTKLVCGNPGAPANRGRLHVSLRDLRTQYEFIVIDATGTSPSGEGVALGSLSDGVLLIINAGKTRRKAALRVLESLRAANVEVLGAVLNGRRFYIPGPIYRHL